MTLCIHFSYQPIQIMNKKQAAKSTLLLAALTANMVLTGCAGVRPKSLAKPEKLSCIQVLPGTEAHEVRGLFDVKVTTRLTPGPYFSERQDAEGTYYRAPAGGIYFGADATADQPNKSLVPRVMDGGIWLPRVPGKSPHLYTFFSTSDSTIIPVPDNASCATAVFIPDPQSQGVDAVAFATGGAIGGAAGGAIARSAAPGKTMSFGQAAGTGLVGGALGGLLVAGLINMDIGKINHHPVATDPKFQAALEKLLPTVTDVPAAPAVPQEAPARTL